MIIPPQTGFNIWLSIGASKGCANPRRGDVLSACRWPSVLAPDSCCTTDVVSMSRVNWDANDFEGWEGCGFQLVGGVAVVGVVWLVRPAPPRALTLTLSRAAGEGIVGDGWGVGGGWGDSWRRVGEVGFWLVGPAAPGIPRSLRSRPFRFTKGAIAP